MWKLYVLLIVILIPREFTFNLGSLALNPLRIYLILLAPSLLFSLFANSKIKPTVQGIFLFLICIWPFIALTVNTSFSKGVESGGILFLETFFPYLIARQTVTSVKRLHAFSKMLLTFIVVLTIVALPEIFTGTHYAHKFFSAITGNFYFTKVSTRLGLWRAYGLTDHPIVLGSFCASGFIIAVYLIGRHKKYVFYAMMSFLGVFASLSSAPLLGVLGQSGMALWSKVFRKHRYKWWLLFILFIFCYVIVDFLSNRDPIRVMFSYLLFSEHNGYVRYYMWLYSFFVINQSFFTAIFGYGFSGEMFNLIDNFFFSSLMKRSVDSYWLVNLLRYGWPMVIFLMGFIFCSIRQNRSSANICTKRSDKKLLEAWFILIVSFTMIGITVHFWAGTSSFYFVLLACASLKVKNKLKKVECIELDKLN